MGNMSEPGDVAGLTEQMLGLNTNSYMGMEYSTPPMNSPFVYNSPQSPQMMYQYVPSGQPVYPMYQQGSVSQNQQNPVYSQTGFSPEQNFLGEPHPNGTSQDDLNGNTKWRAPRDRFEGKSEETDPCNLFIKYLPPSVDDEGLRKLFNPFGKISSCKVMLDTAGASLGYGFVRFANADDASEAIVNMNGLRLVNKTLLCKNSHIGRRSRRPQQTVNLVIRNLPLTMEDDTFNELMMSQGPVTEARIIRNKSGESNGMAIVKMTDMNAASAMIQALNGLIVDEIAPSLDVSFQDESLAYQDENLMPSEGLPFPVPQNDQKPTLDIQSQMHMMDNSMPLQMPDPSMSQPMQPMMMNHMMQMPQYPMPGSGTPPMPPVFGYLPPMVMNRQGSFSNGRSSRNLFVFHLPTDFDDEGLKSLFEPFGQIVSAKVGIDPVHGERKGYGFVNFKRPQDASRAKMEMNGLHINNKVLKVSFKKDTYSSGPSSPAIFPQQSEYSTPGSDIAGDAVVAGLAGSEELADDVVMLPPQAMAADKHHHFSREL